MTDTVITIESLGKRYRLGERQRYRTLRDSVSHAVSAGTRRLSPRRLQPSGTAADVSNGDHNFVWALRDVSLEVKQGEVLGVIGHNGAGKSTLLKILSRITYPTEGRVTVRGRLGSLLEVGTGFHTELTGRENIYLNGTILGLSRAEIKRKFDDIVAFSEVEDFLDTPVKRYSSGMLVRLAFAVAAHLEPDILIVDEVLAVGDVAFQRKCLGKMGDVAREGRTILFVSHNMDAIQRLCTRSILIDHGRLAATGDTNHIIGRYLSTSITSALPGNWIDVSNARRTGSGAARVHGVKFCSDDPSLHGRPYTGGPFDVSLKILSDAPRTIRGIAIMLYDKNGTKLVNASTQSLDHGATVQAGSNVFSLQIDALHLNPGTYTLGWWLANDYSSPLDFCESAVAFDVMGNHDGDGDLRARGDGVVACRFSVNSHPLVIR